MINVTYESKVCSNFTPVTLVALSKYTIKIAALTLKYINIS